MPLLPSVTPLKKVKQNGQPYARRGVIETALAQLISLDASELERRARVEQPDDSDYFPGECLIYFIREHYAAASAGQMVAKKFVNALSEVLFRRAVRKVHASLHYLPEQQRSDITSECMLALNELFFSNSTSLDYYEVNFNSALETLVIDQQRRQRNETEMLSADPHESAAQEKTARNFQSDGLEGFVESSVEHSLRSPEQLLLQKEDVAKALSLLVFVNDKDREAWILRHIFDYQFQSNDPDEQTISKHQLVSERTARERVKRAEEHLEKLRSAPE